jgi:NDP-sugar pyrophosphorylase family protein
MLRSATWQTKDVSNVPTMILAGGLGTRLRPAFNSGPKSMAPVDGRPFLEYLLLQVGRAGFRDVLLCVGYGREKVEEWAGDGKKWGLEIRYSAEPVPLGTGGAIKFAAKLIDSEAFLVLNGDSFLSVDLGDLVRQHLRSGAWATIALAKVRDRARYGTVILKPDGDIEAFLEKSTAAVTDSCGWYLVNGGVYVFNKLVLDLVPEMTAVSLEHEVFPRLLLRGVKGFVTEGYFIDIGLPDDFKRAQTELPECF